MKRAASTLILLAVALALGAYIYFVEMKRKSASEQALEKAKVFENLDSSAIEELRVKTGDQNTLVRKEGATWRVIEPIQSAADENMVTSVTSALGTLEMQRVVDEQPADASQFGLAPPKAEVTFRVKGDSTPRVLQVGEKTATGGDLYAKVGTAPRVFLVPGYLDTTFAKSAYDLRDKSVLAFERDKVTGIELSMPIGPVTLAKEGDAWAIKAPTAMRADFGAVEGLIGRLSSAQMKSIVSEAPTDLAQYGLDKPSSRVSVVAGSGRSTLLFGAKSPDGFFYAKDGSRPLVFTVDTVITDDLNKGADEYRPKDLFEFKTFSGKRFEFTRAGMVSVFEKQKAKDPTSLDTWTRLEPKADKPIEPARLEDFLSKISNLRAQSFVASLPPKAAEAGKALAQWDDGKKSETVTFYRDGTNVFATRAGEPGAAAVTTTDFDDMLKAFDALK